MKLRTTTASLFFVAAIAAPAGAADWLQFRGPGGLGIAQDSGLPATWDDAKNVLWKTELPGPGASSPIVVGKKVLLTCYSGYGSPGRKGEEMEGLKRHLVCIDRSSGKLLWSSEVAAPLPEEEYQSYQALHGYASSTPVSDGERAYVFFGKAGVFAFDLDGKQIWQAGVGDRTHGWGSATSPVLYKDLVIVNAGVESGALVALRKGDGKEAWRKEGMARSWSTPLLFEAGGRLAVSVHRRLLAFDPGTGEELWRCEGIQDYVCPSLIRHQGVVYAIGGRSSTALAVRAGGKGDVTKTHLGWTIKRGSNVSSPVHHDGHLYWASESRGIVYCASAADGKLVYEERLQPAPDRIYASPLLADGKIYYVSRTRGTYVLEARPAFKLLAQNTMKDDPSVFNSSPAVSDGQLFLRSDRFLYCIGEKR